MGHEERQPSAPWAWKVEGAARPERHAAGTSRAFRGSPAAMMQVATCPAGKEPGLARGHFRCHWAGRAGRRQQPQSQKGTWGLGVHPLPTSPPLGGEGLSGRIGVSRKLQGEDST